MKFKNSIKFIYTDVIELYKNLFVYDVENVNVHEA